MLVLKILFELYKQVIQLTSNGRVFTISMQQLHVFLNPILALLWFLRGRREETKSLTKFIEQLQGDISNVPFNPNTLQNEEVISEIHNQ